MVKNVLTGPGLLSKGPRRRKPETAVYLAWQTDQDYFLKVLSFILMRKPGAGGFASTVL
jgi:hypothetical protein